MPQQSYVSRSHDSFSAVHGQSESVIWKKFILPASGELLVAMETSVPAIRIITPRVCRYAVALGSILVLILVLKMEPSRNPGSIIFNGLAF
ncbi:hypothetical protein GOODEAATRI_032762 [Goodea atripinnis]|uniref:Uncharacterized protein n=1 Tax=Goodea atripinnis TaxID=208336 RepID=A0ABV0MX25_9TELE